MSYSNLFILPFFFQRRRLENFVQNSDINLCLLRSDVQGMIAENSIFRDGNFFRSILRKMLADRLSKRRFNWWRATSCRHRFENLLIDFPTREFYGFFLGVFLNSSWRPLKISFMTSQTHSSLFFSTSRIPRTKFTWNIFVATETRNCCKWT